VKRRLLAGRGTSAPGEGRKRDSTPPSGNDRYPKGREELQEIVMEAETVEEHMARVQDEIADADVDSLRRDPVEAFQC
jgi:hypothetical protein